MSGEDGVMVDVILRWKRRGMKKRAALPWLPGLRHFSFAHQGTPLG